MRARVAALVAGLAAGLASWPAGLQATPQLRTAPAVPDFTSRTPTSSPIAAPAAGPASAPAPAWDTVSADVTIRRSTLRRDGSAGPVAPEIRYRWVRTLGESGWKTSLTVVSIAPITVQTATGPRTTAYKSPVSRIEIGDPRTPARAFDAAGRLIFMLPTPAKPAETPSTSVDAGQPADPTRRAALDAPPIPADVFDLAAASMRSRDWVEQLLPTAAGRDARRAALTRQMGAPQGMVRGLQRFVTTSGDATTEVLSDPTWLVPYEVNVVHDGVLTSHSTISYAEDPGAGLVRRRLKTEQLVSAESGDRAVVDVEFANIRLDRSGVR